jgi:outer membrane biosynthesis protein TonB
MPSLDNLPGEQRAVLEMVLKHGRSYDEIARLLSMDRAKVRERAQIALDTIGPHTEVAPNHQHLIADYLLGQLSDTEAREVRDLLADSPSDRAWARVVASELAPLTGDKPLPEIPVERSTPREPDAPAAGRAGPIPEPAPVTPTPEPTAPEPLSPPPVAGSDPASPEAEPKRRRSSRLGGALVILVGVIAVAVVLVVVLRSGHSKKHPTASTTAAAPAASGSSTPTASTPTTPTTATTGTSSASVVAQINLTPPSSIKNSKSAGIAEVLNEGSTDGVAIVAQKVPANTTKPPNAYAVWLYNSSKDAKLLGFVSPAVNKSGRLQTAGQLPTNASRFKQLIVTVETTAKPKTPGSILLQGALTGL